MGQRAARGSRGCGEAGRYEEQAEERALLKGEQASDEVIKLFQCADQRRTTRFIVMRSILRLQRDEMSIVVSHLKQEIDTSEETSQVLGIVGIGELM